MAPFVTAVEVFSDKEVVFSVFEEWLSAGFYTFCGSRSALKASQRGGNLNIQGSVGIF